MSEDSFDIAYRENIALHRAFGKLPPNFVELAAASERADIGPKCIGEETFLYTMSGRGRLKVNVPDPKNKAKVYGHLVDIYPGAVARIPPYMVHELRPFMSEQLDVRRVQRLI